MTILTRAPAFIRPRGFQAPRWPWTFNKDSLQAEGLVAFYSFIPGVGLRDLSGNGHDGTFAGAGLPIWSVSSAGKWGLEFTGTQRIEAPNAVGDSLESAGTVAFMWEHADPQLDSHIFDTRKGGLDGWFIRPRASGNIDFRIDTGASVEVIVAATAGFRLGAARYTGANMFLDTDENSDSAAQSGLATRTKTTRIGNRDADDEPLGTGRPLVHIAVYGYAWPDALVAQFLGGERYDLYYELGRVLYFFPAAVVGDVLMAQVMM